MNIYLLKTIYIQINIAVIHLQPCGCGHVLRQFGGFLLAAGIDLERVRLIVEVNDLDHVIVISIG